MKPSDTMAAQIPSSTKKVRAKSAAKKTASLPVAAADGQLADTWDQASCDAIIGQLWTLRGKLLAYENSLAPHLENLDPGYRTSARNFAHYLRLRQSDRRPLQESLARVGLSSLGRAESHVLANLDKVLGILHRMTGKPWRPPLEDEPVGMESSRKLLERHTDELLGAPPAERAVRIMVTLSTEAAADYGLVRQLVQSGMDIARINCAHDTADQWRAMAANVRRAAKAERRPVRILMDVGGPKLRTGPLPAGDPVLKLRPLRDEFGRVLMPCLVGLRANGASTPVTGASAHAGVDTAWLAQLELGDHIDLTDARGAKRSLQVVLREDAGVLAECVRTAYLVAATRLKRRRKGARPRSSPCPACRARRDYCSWRAAISCT
ncbi:MAG: pyruvate kinase [Sulfuritalea sp.]|nr:pyruvate kinase [Sulfuritalea sp.]